MNFCKSLGLFLNKFNNFEALCQEINAVVNDSTCQKILKTKKK